MAKKRGRGRSAANRTIGGFAEDLGRILGTAERKAGEWLNQRQAIADQLTQVRDTASELLTRLVGGERNMAGGGRRGRRGGAGNRGPGRPAAVRKRRRMSARARKAVSIRMRKYWAERRKAKAAK
jgi:hypothetical protein